MEQLVTWWQHIPLHINPVFVQLGSIQIRYYGLMYMLSIIVVYIGSRYRLKTEQYSYSKDLLDDCFFWSICATLIGARLGYVLFYKLVYFSQNPLEIFLPFHINDGLHFIGISGMSYHGGLIGFVLGLIIFCKIKKIAFWKFTDFLVPVIPLGYTFGRIGNFLNGELFGRVTQKPWGMYFPGAATFELRHPSQLYEAFFEGIILFIILWVLRKKNIFDGFSAAFYLIGYGLVRFVIEYFRQPDEHIGFIIGSFSIGQIFCLMMILLGAGLYVARTRSNLNNV